MKKMINLLFALLLSLSIISCGSSDSGGGDSGASGSIKLPGVKGDTDNTPINPDTSDDVQTGTSSSTGCSEAKLPGCKA